jgi:T5orf172 domain
MSEIIIEDDITKQCTSCEMEKSIRLFNRLAKGKHGVESMCKACRKEYNDGRKTSVKTIPVTPEQLANEQPSREALFKEIRGIDIGYTYFILSPSYYDAGINKVKIGFTNNLQSRLSTGQTFNPEEIIIYAYIESRRYKEIESFLHKVCNHRQLRGEWYNLSLVEIDKIVYDFNSMGPIYQAFMAHQKHPKKAVRLLFLTSAELAEQAEQDHEKIEILKSEVENLKRIVQKLGKLKLSSK